MINRTVAFGRLCVETIFGTEKALMDWKTVAFERLCVETIEEKLIGWAKSSRLRAAVC